MQLSIRRWRIEYDAGIEHVSERSPCRGSHGTDTARSTRRSEPSRRDWLSRLRAEIESDRQTLTDVMRRLNITESLIKQMTGWFGEKLATLKLTVESPDRAFHLMEALEFLSLGILGKHKLWAALEQVAGEYPTLRGVDFTALRGRAIDQHAQVEQERLSVAAKALSPIAAKTT